MSISRRLHPLLHRVLVTMLVACSFACCCQQRTLAALFSSEDAAPAATGCCDGCCARQNASDERADGNPGDRTSRSPAERERHPAERERHPVGRCDSACCTKADIKTPQFTLGCDEIGATLGCVLVLLDAPADDRANDAIRLDDDVGEPPPWLRLLVSARLRI